MTIIQTTLPLPLEAMKQAITTPDATIVIQYAQAKLKGRTALIYLTNANIPNARFDMTDVPREEVFDLIDAYITQKSTLNNRNLVDSLLQILYAGKGINVPPADQQSIDVTSLITREEVGQYFAKPERAQNLLRLVHVLDSLLVFIYYSNAAFKGTEGDDPAVPVINDIDYTGFTFVNLLEIESFMISYFTAPATNGLAYFKQQFEEYMYGGRNLFSYMSNTYIMPLLSEVLNGSISVESIHQANVESAAFV